MNYVNSNIISESIRKLDYVKHGKSDFTEAEKQSIIWPGIPYVLQRILALLGLILISPLLLGTVLAIRIESRGPALFSQIRVGAAGRRFRIFKFRSMYQKTDPRYREPTSSDREGVCAKSFSDPRITRVGKVIRKLSIDELPQLFNVVLGDMALIGPRPALPMEVDAYGFSQLERLDCVPGLTGLWQVSGRADTTFLEQVSLDVHYVRERSLGLDLKILFATVPAVLLGKGAY